MTTLEMECALARFYNPRTCIIVPNVSWGFRGEYEKDLVIIRKSGYAVEVEIKISFSDFKKDFTKRHSHNSKYMRHFYYAFPSSLYEKRKADILALVPERAGILTVHKHGYGQTGVLQERPARARSGAIKLTEKQQLQIARLGTMRIWSLKNMVRTK